MSNLREEYQLAHNQYISQLTNNQNLIEQLNRDIPYLRRVLELKELELQALEADNRSLQDCIDNITNILNN